jgi:hypothetical protein
MSKRMEVKILNIKVHKFGFLYHEKNLQEV